MPDIRFGNGTSPVAPPDRRCGAKNRPGCKNPVCQRWPVRGSRRCHRHGGRTPSGLDSPHFRHGLRGQRDMNSRRSRALPERLIQRYEEAVADVTLLELREDIALSEARIEDLLKRVDTGEAGETWRSLRETFYELRKALDKGDSATTAQAIDTIGVLIAEGASDYRAWDELAKERELRRRLTETESKRLKEMGQYLPAAQAVALVASCVGIIRKHVTDPDTLRLVSADFGRLLHGGDAAGHEPGRLAAAERGGAVAR